MIAQAAFILQVAHPNYLQMQLPHQLRQLRHIHRKPPGFVSGHERSTPRPPLQCANPQSHDGKAAQTSSLPI